MARRAIEQENTEKKKNPPQVERRFWQPIRLLIVLAFLSGAAKSGADSMVNLSNYNSLNNYLQRLISEIQFDDMSFPIELLKDPNTTEQQLLEEVNLRDEKQFYSNFSQFLTNLNTYRSSQGQQGRTELIAASEELIDRLYALLSPQLQTEQTQIIGSLISKVGQIRAKAFMGETLPEDATPENLTASFYTAISTGDLIRLSQLQFTLSEATRTHEAVKQANQNGKDAARNTVLFLGAGLGSVFIGRRQNSSTEAAESTEKKKNQQQTEPPKRKIKPQVEADEETPLDFEELVHQQYGKKRKRN